MLKNLFLSVILISGSCVYGQQADNKVILTDVSGSASGDIKDGQTIVKDSFSGEVKPSSEKKWKHGKCMRKKSVTPYRITNKQYVSRSTIKKSINTDHDVKIKIMQNGHDNTDIEDLSLAYDSGNEYRMGNVYGIQNSTFPLYVKVTYKSWNTFHAVQSDVAFEFTITSPGSWDVTIFN
jgi:hypothetical protein